MNRSLGSSLPHSDNVSCSKLQNSVVPIAPVLQNDMEVKSLNILVCSTGSVATIKLPVLVAELNNNIDHVKLHVALTEKAEHFCPLSDLKSSPIESICLNNDWKSCKEPNLHEKLAQTADVLLIAPLDANTLAKIANGLCDNLVTSVARVWDYQNKVAACCPAMNTQMWIHPITEQHLKKIESFGVFVIPPIEKKLMCGDVGVGAMAEPIDIALALKHFIFSASEKRVHNTSISIDKELVNNAT